MSAHCEKCGQAKWLPGVYETKCKRIEKVILYCSLFSYRSWAKGILSIIFDCDFKEAEAELVKYKADKAFENGKA